MGKVIDFRGSGTNREDRDENWMFVGLGGLAIVIEDLDPIALEAGLNRTNLQFRIEKRLGEMGIPIAPIVAIEEADDVAVLYVAVGAEQHPSGTVACFLSLQVCDAARLERDLELGGGVVTWQSNDYWPSSFEDVEPDMMKALDDALAGLGTSFRVSEEA